jgi:hypothetical protein
MVVFSFPWPGPGNSDAPDDPEGWVDEEGGAQPRQESMSEASLIAAFPWPGPGNSEGWNTG